MPPEPESSTDVLHVIKFSSHCCVHHCLVQHAEDSFSATLHLPGSPVTPAGALIFFFFQHLFWLLLGGVQPGTLPLTLPLISPFYSRLLDVSFYFTLSSEYTKHLTHLTFLKHNSHFPSVLPNPQERALPSTNVATQKKSMGVTTHPSLALPFCFKFLPPLWKDSQAYSPLPTSAIIVLTCLDCSFSHLAELFLTLLYPHR